MPHNWIHKLNESNSKLHKLDVIKQALEAASIGAKDADEFLNLAWYALNPFNVFNTKKVPTTDAVTTNTGTISSFIDLLQSLQLREFTGNAAIAELERASMNYESDLWNSLLRPVILKNLRVGATISSFNKVLKGTKYEIPIFESQLAVDSAKHPKKLIGKKILEPKLDGIRALAIVDRSFPEKTKVTIFSRNGKPLDNFPHIEEQLINCLKSHQSGAPWNENRMEQFVFDGEIVSENFQALMKQAQRKTDIDTSNAVFTIFDVIPLVNFNKGKWSMPQKKRSNEWLGSIRDRVNASCSSLHIIKGIEVDLDTTEGHDIMQRYGDEQVELGYEGIMVKDPEAPYLCKRRTAWMKWKPFITVDLKIVGFELGKPGGKNEHRLGALICEGTDGGKFIRVNAGGGYTDKQRDEFWDNREDLLGHIVEIKADCLTLSENADDVYSLRFPRFLRFRGFEAGEKI